MQNKKKLNLSWPMLIALMAGAISLIYFIFMSLTAIKGLPFISFINNTFYRQQINALPHAVNQLINTKFREFSVKTWKLHDSGKLDKTFFSKNKVIIGFWYLNQKDKMIKFTGPQGEHNINYSSNWIQHLAGIPVNTPFEGTINNKFISDFKKFVPTKETLYTPLGSNIVVNEDSLFCAQVEIKPNPGNFRGLMVNKKEFFKKIVLPSMKLCCSDNYMGIELLDSKGATLKLATYKNISDNLKALASIGSDKKSKVVPLTGIMSGFDIRIHYKENFIKNILPRFFFMSQTYLWLTVILIISSLMYFYLKAKKQEDELCLKNDWIANIAHSILGPLHSISALVEASDQMNTLLPMVKKEIKRIESLCSKFVRMARAGLNQMNLKKESLKIEPLIQNTINILSERHNFPEKNFELINLDIALIDADPQALYEIFEALIDNAIKYSPEKGKITISCEKTDDSIIIKIKDYGIGIAADNFKMIGKPFFRLNIADTEGINGTGLGIYLSKKILAAMSGKLILISEGEGKGTTAKITFPLA